MSETPPVLSRVPGQDDAVTFLARAAQRPGHAYLLAGPEGSGKALAARAFAASLLCERGGVRGVPGLQAGTRRPTPERGRP